MKQGENVSFIRISKRQDWGTPVLTVMNPGAGNRKDVLLTCRLGDSGSSTHEHDSACRRKNDKNEDICNMCFGY